MGVASSCRVDQHSHTIFLCIASGVSCPGDIGSRSTSGDTGESELRAVSIEVRDFSEQYALWYSDISFMSEK